MSNSIKNMYLFSRRNHNRHLCLLYAVQEAARRGGWMKAHICDRDCNHLQACEECTFCVATEIDKPLTSYCGIGILMNRGCTFTEAYDISRDLTKHAPLREEEATEVTHDYADL